VPSPAARDCWFLTGPTAAGKTAVGVELAERIGAEIVSMDSMALYRGLDIGTAKPSAAQRGRVPHHLIDVLEPDQEYSLAHYLDAAGECVRQIQSRGREVLFIGGTPLYLKGLLRGIFRGPSADWQLRRQLEEDARQNGPGFLHRRLAEVDPLAAGRIHPNDTRRLVRAIEVFVKTGQPISSFQQQFEVGAPAEACRVFVLDWPREELNARIDRRVDQMFAQGLVEEVRRLLFGSNRQDACPTGPNACPTGLSKTARQAVGYREVIEHLEGRNGLAETIDRVKMHTRQFAKRQGTWFRSLSECRFVPVDASMAPAEIAGRIAQ
jgi:tRNA dimethylallyltransferase